MALAKAIQHSLRPAQRITWTDEDGDPLDITGATITGSIRPNNGDARPITGALTVITGNAGLLEWQYSAADVAEAGLFDVQLTATYPSGPTPARTKRATFEILSSH